MATTDDTETRRSNKRSKERSNRILRNQYIKLSLFGLAILIIGSVFFLTPALAPSTVLSIILYFIFAPWIGFLERHGVTRSLATFATFTVMVLLITISIKFTVPYIEHEITSLQNGKMQYSELIHKRLKSYELKLATQYSVLRDAQLTERLFRWVDRSITDVSDKAPNIASQIFMCLFLVPVFTCLLLNESRNVRNRLLKLAPNRQFELIYSLSYRIINKMGGYVAARILEAILIAAMVTTAAFILRIPYAFFLGIFAGITNPIPYLGPLIGAIPGVLVAILEPSQSGNILFWILLIYVFANIVDTVFIFPLLVAQVVEVHPVIVIVSVFLGGEFFGIMGMIAAVPIISVANILIQEFICKLYPDLTPRT